MRKLHIKFIDGYWFCMSDHTAAYAESPLHAWRDAMGFSRETSD